MSDPWLTIVGLGEDGLPGLPDASRAVLDRAEVIFGGPRHLALVGAAERGREWPVPFDIGPVLALRGWPVVVLASGDPFWFGAGGSLATALPPAEWRALSVAGVFSLAAARLGWRIERTTCLGLHEAPFEKLRPHLAAGWRGICTLRDGAAAGELAQWLTAHGWGQSRLWVLEALGGSRERIREGRADSLSFADVQPPVAMAIDAAGDHGLPGVPGLSEALFAHDGQITKSAVRALTLAALGPRRGEVLWDLGAGSGAVSVEWALAGGWVEAVECRQDRAANVRANAAAFGLGHRIAVHEGRALDLLTRLPDPQAIFVGGGFDAALFGALPRSARLVVNAVTLETEALLIHLHGQYGGELTRVELSRVAPLGPMRGWTSSRPVVQWSLGPCA